MWEGILGALTPESIAVVVFGVLLGIIIGAIPGLTATFGIALLIPVTFLMPPEAGMIMLSGIYAGAIYGGSISAILLNIPGTPASIVSAWEGHTLVMQGRAPLALSLSAISSGIGGLSSGLALFFLTPPLAQITLAFGAPEYVALVLFSLIVVIVMLESPLVANTLAALLGLLLASVGLDPIQGMPRFTFGFYPLMSGLNVVAVLVGFFCLPQAFVLARESLDGVRYETIGKIGAAKLRDVLGHLKRRVGTLLRASGIGTVLGILPAIGPETTPFVCHALERRFAPKTEAFGKGSVQGLIAAETSNSANVGGSLIPLLALGIPGSGAAAVFIGALTLHGLRPGPLLFAEQTSIVYSFFMGFIFVNLFMTVVGLFGARYFAAVLRLPKGALAAFITFFSIFGAYAVNNSLFDVWVMFAAGLLALVLGALGIPILPVVLGFILGGLLEQNLAVLRATADGPGYLYLLERPITLVLLAASVLILLTAIWRRTIRRKNAPGSAVSVP